MGNRCLRSLRSSLKSPVLLFVVVVDRMLIVVFGSTLVSIFSTVKRNIHFAQWKLCGRWWQHVSFWLLSRIPSLVSLCQLYSLIEDCVLHVNTNCSQCVKSGLYIVYFLEMSGLSAFLFCPYCALHSSYSYISFERLFDPVWSIWLTVNFYKFLIEWGLRSGSHKTKMLTSYLQMTW